MPRILLVEDVLIAQKVASMTLKALNCEVFTALTGKQALELFTEHSFDFVFLDLGLPDIDGITVCENMRKLEEGKTHTPIAALTAHDDDSDDLKQKCFAAGMNEFLLKPLTHVMAQEMVNKYTK